MAMARGRADGLLLFCDFIAHRLYTENVELLERIIHEVHATPRSATTVSALLAVGYPAITIVAVDHDDASALAYARALLKSVRLGREGPMDVIAMRNLYATLHCEIRLVNWHWLVAMYYDFCAGHETTIMRFVAGRGAAIAVFPIAPLRVQETDGKKAIKSDGDEKMEIEPEPQAASSSSDSSDDDSSSSSSSDPRGEDSAAATIRRVCERIERTAPWEQLFDVSNIVYPFDAHAHKSLAANLRKFWQRHARAVWERKFWSPYSVKLEIRGTPYYERKVRQQFATDVFVKRVILPAYTELGAEFFVTLDAQRQRCHWWWFQEPLVDLEKMSTAVGLDKCLKYVQTQAMKREPSVPRGFFNTSRANKAPVSVSMWSRWTRTAHIAAAISKLRGNDIASMDARSEDMSDDTDSD